MADSWEEAADEQIVMKPQQPAQQSVNLNPNARTFTFNPGASSWAPPGAAAAPPPPPGQPAPPPAAARPAFVPPPPRPVDQEMPDASRARPDADSDMHMEPASNGPSADSVGRQMEHLHVNGPSSSQPPPPERPPPPAPAAAPPAAHAPGPASTPAAASTSAAVEAPSHSAAQHAHTHHDETDDDEENEEARAAREAELRRIYEELSKADDREHLNIVFIGHVDAGKSTTGGQILYLTGGVDQRTIEKYEKDAKEKNRESWYMAYIMDTNEEERAKGKTVEVGRAQFTTTKKRYTILDAPGHKNYVPNMISGASQADVGVLVIAARKGEFETGFERGGQTREHAQLAKTLGVAKLIVAINKMDDPSVAGPNGEWSQERFNEIKDGLTPFLKGCGYNIKRDLIFLPMSGLLGINIKDPVPKKTAPWFNGPTLFEALDNVETLKRDPLAPFRMSIMDRYREMGTIAMGKSEAGIVRKNDKLYVMPNKVPVQVISIRRDDIEVEAAMGGENLQLRLAGIEETEISAGFVLSSRHHPVPAVTYFEAQLQILDLLEHKAIFSAGYKAILHVHSLVEECEITRLLCQIDPKTKTKKPVKFVKSGSAAMVLIAVEKAICVEKFDTVPQLGRFTLRDEGRTIAIGKITKLPKSLKAGDEVAAK